MKEILLQKKDPVKIDEKTLENIGFTGLYNKFIPSEIVDSKKKNKWITEHLTYNETEIKSRNIILNFLKQKKSRQALESVYKSSKMIESFLGEIRRRNNNIIRCVFMLNILKLFIDSLNILKDEFCEYTDMEVQRIYDYLEHLSQSNDFVKISQCYLQAKSIIPHIENITLGVNIGELGDAYAVSLLDINDISGRTKGVLEHKDASCVGGLFPDIPIKEYSAKPYLENYIVEQLGKKLKNEIRLVKRHLKQVDMPFINKWLEFSRHLELYIIGLNYIETINKRKIPYSFPELSSDGICADKLYYPQMALSDFSPLPVPQSMRILKSTTTIVTGANSAGKTTFLKSIAQNCLLAQLGLPVLADKFCMAPYKRYMSVFSEGEDNSFNMSRFQKEAKNMASAIKFANEKTLILLNEPFTSTNPIEALDLLTDSLIKLSKSKSSQILVTHIYDIYYTMVNREESLVNSYVIESRINDEDITYLFNAVNKEPDGESYAQIIAGNYGLSAEKLVQNNDSRCRIEEFLNRRLYNDKTK